MSVNIFLRRFGALRGRCARPLSAVLVCAAAVLPPMVRAVPVAAPSSDTVPIPAVLGQSAAPASWASHALMLSVARAGSGLVAVGEHGFILLSGDDGRSWSQARTVPTSVTLTRVRFATPTEGWAVGHMGMVLHTTDAGATWSRVTDGAATSRLALRRVEALAAGHGADAVAALRAGAAQLVQDGPDKPLLALLADEPGHALALGAFGTGVRMSGVPVGPASLVDQLTSANALHIYGLARSADAVYAVGEQGLLLQSRQGGPFLALASPYKGTYFGVLALPTGEVLAYGLRGNVLRSADGGKSWVRTDSGTQQSINGAVLLGGGEVLLGSQGGQLLVSRDGGRSFSSYAQVAQPVTDLAQARDGTVIVAGPRGLMRVVRNVAVVKAEA